MNASTPATEAVAVLSPLVWATFLMLASAVVGLWAARSVALIILVGAIGFGYASGALAGPAAAWLVLFALACWTYRRARSESGGAKSLVLRLTALAGIVVLGLGLALHRLPGFHNPHLMSAVVLSPKSAPYDLWLNFDKTAAGLILLALCYEGLIRSPAELTGALKRAAVPGVITVAVLLGLSVALGYVGWAPKWSGTFWLWAPVNLLSTCMSEEAFFRGFIQNEIKRAAASIRGGTVIAIGSSAALFGLAHLAGGWMYVGLATAAGLGYAIVYHRSGRVEASILTHFSLNATHFLLFTYPYLEHAGSR